MPALNRVALVCVLVLRCGSRKKHVQFELRAWQAHVVPFCSKRMVVRALHTPSGTSNICSNLSPQHRYAMLACLLTLALDLCTSASADKPCYQAWTRQAALHVCRCVSHV